MLSAWTTATIKWLLNNELLFSIDYWYWSHNYFFNIRSAKTYRNTHPLTPSDQNSYSACLNWILVNFWHTWPILGQYAVKVAPQVCSLNIWERSIVDRNPGFRWRLVGSLNPQDLIGLLCQCCKRTAQLIFLCVCGSGVRKLSI